MHLINDTSYSLLLFKKTCSNRMVEGLCFMSEFSYMTEFRLLIVRSYFSVRQYLATVGFFVYFVGVFVYFKSDSILRPID